MTKMLQVVYKVNEITVLLTDGRLFIATLCSLFEIIQILFQLKHLQAAGIATRIPSESELNFPSGVFLN